MPGAAVLLAATGFAAASASRMGASVPAARTVQPRLARRAAPTAALDFDFSACLTQFLETGGLQCVTASGLSQRAVVDDVVAGLTGGFVGVSGTVISLELGKQAAKEELKCEYCSGEGTLKCGECFGAGCKACGGTGRVSCVSCGGSGRAISSDMEKQQFRAIFGLFPEMRYGPESTMFDERDGVMSLGDWDGTIVSAQAEQARAKKGAQAGGAGAGDDDDATRA